MERSRELFERASHLLPGGVNSPVRAFRSVSGTPPFILSASGCRLTDADGREYLDYIGSWGPMILGHAHTSVTASVIDAAKRGTSFGTPNPTEISLAELILKRVPSLDKIRFVNSGTEATMSAIRLARAAKKRDGIIKFAGCYHGHADPFLIHAGSGVATLGLPDSPGVTKGAAKDTFVATFNDLDSVKAILEKQQGKIAAVIVEPIAGNMGVVPPADGFLAGLRTLCYDHDALLIFDEVMTGFRVHKGGAQELYGIRPDLTTFGKIIGGGLPVGAYGGSEELMSMVAPQGPVYQAGTLSGNPLAMAAGAATLALLDDKKYDLLEELGSRLEEGLLHAASEFHIPVTVQRVGSMLTLFFREGAVRNYDDARKADHNRFATFFHSLLAQGIHLPPSGYEAWFISTAHSNKVIDHTIDAALVAMELIASN